MEYTQSLNKIDDYKVGDEVMVLMETLKAHGATEWRRGKVVAVNHVSATRPCYRSYGYNSGNNSYNYPIVEVERTYYRKTKDLYNGVVWVGEEGEIYNKINQEGFVQNCQIKKIFVDNLLISK
jgi:hypothetical protein